MGKFLNQEYTNEINNLVDGFKDRLKNPYYRFGQTKETIVTYFNINKENTGFDDATGLYNRHLTEPNVINSIKYNRIDNFIIYGIEKISLYLEDGDEGAETSEVSGDATILPNTIIPYPGDHFIINHINENIIFRVVEVQSDTFENGANCYKISYKLISSDEELFNGLYENSVDDYQFILQNVGTSYNPLLLNSEVDTIESLDSAASTLRKYYKDIFYSERVQSLIFFHCNKLFYDQYLTRFIIDTDILNGGDEYLYVSQQLPEKADFNIKYDRTFFNYLINKRKNKLNSIISESWGLIIENPTTIFASRYEDYYSLQYEAIQGMNPTFLHDLVFNPFNAEFIHRIINNDLYDDNKDVLKNIIIKYFNDDIVANNDLDNLENIDYLNNWELFYYIPCVIYCLDKYAENIMSFRRNDK